MDPVDEAARDVFQFQRFWNAAFQTPRFWNAAMWSPHRPN